MDSLLIKDVLTDTQRKYLLKYSIPLLIEGDEISRRLSDPSYYPGKQTPTNLHKFSYFKEIHSIFLKCIKQYTGYDCMINKSWVNWTNGSKKDISWHNHENEGKLSAVYYLELSKKELVTEFKNKKVKTEEGDVLIFPSYMLHRSPINKSNERKTVI